MEIVIYVRTVELLEYRVLKERRYIVVYHLANLGEYDVERRILLGDGGGAESHLPSPGLAMMDLMLARKTFWLGTS